MADSYFTLQYVDKYTVRHATSQVQEQTSLQLYRFRSMHGQQPHEWRFTQARLIFLTNGVSNFRSTIKSDAPENQYPCWRGLYIFDSSDDSMALQLKELMTASDRPDPDQIELYTGVGQIIENVIYLINSRWSEFFDDADVHLRVLVSQITLSYWSCWAESGRAKSVSAESSPPRSSSNICKNSTGCLRSGQ